MSSTSIYVQLLDEGTICWRPVRAEHLGGGVYRIADSPRDDTEIWEFQTGDMVRCEHRWFTEAGPAEALVAVAKVEPESDSH